MNYSTIILDDFVNGEGVRCSLFLSGCNFHCPGCFNPEAQDFSYGHPYTKTVDDYIRNYLSSTPHIQGLSLLGGDPLCQKDEDIMALVDLCKFTHSLEYKHTSKKSYFIMPKDVWLWSGYTWEEIIYNGTEAQKELIENVDIFVDGPFKQELKNHSLVWKGSSNQRIIDVQSSLLHGSAQQPIFIDMKQS